MAEKTITAAAAAFDHLANDSLVDCATGCSILGKSRSGIYKMFSRGELTLIKVGRSSRIRVGELRSVIGVSR